MVSVLFETNLSHLEHLHHLIPQMIDHLHRNPPRLGLFESPRHIAVQRLPRLLVDLRLERRLQRLIRIIRSQEIGMPHEEAFLVVIRIHEPAGDAIGIVAAHLAGIGMEYVHAVDLDLNLPLVYGQDIYIRLAEDDEEVALAGILEIVGHVQVRVHAGLEHLDAPQLGEVRRSGHRS